MSKFVIYIVTNDVNNKVYIGQTTNSLKNRFDGHYNSPASSLYQPMHEIGKEHFKISVLDDSATNLDELLELERYYVQKYNSIENGYNNSFPYKTNGRIHSSNHFSTTLDKEIYAKLKSYSKETDIPISKIFDKAVRMYLENVKQ